MGITLGAAAVWFSIIFPGIREIPEIRGVTAQTGGCRNPTKKQLHVAALLPIVLPAKSLTTNTAADVAGFLDLLSINLAETDHDEWLLGIIGHLDIDPERLRG